MFDHTSRISRLQDLMGETGIDDVLLTAGADMPYFSGYSAMPLERITAFVVPRQGEPTLFVPGLEAPRVTQGDFEIVAWGETDDPIGLVVKRLGSSSTVAVGETMWSSFLLDFQSTVFCSTASMALLMAEEIHHRGIADRIHVRKVIYGSERSSVSMRQKISELFGGAELFDIPGLTELYGPGTGIECPDHDCIHYWGDYYLLEIVDPETLQPLPDGEWGEMVVTTLCKEAAPLIRYRTHDITRIIPGPCTCGSILPRHSRLKGRSDDTFKFRGVNIYPSNIDSILSQIPGLGSEYQIHLSRDAESGRDHLRLVVERGAGIERGHLPQLIQDTTHLMKKQLMVTPEVEVVEYGSLPRSEKKSRRVFDGRLEDSVV